MRPRQDAVIATLVLLSALTSTGCGAIFHASQTITFKTRPEDGAVVYRDGVPLAPPPTASGVPQGPVTAPVFLNQASGFVAAAPGKKIAEVDPGTHVDGVAIALDALWCVTIIGVAAPISDALMGTFSKTNDPVEVTLEADPEEQHPLPVYSIEGQTFAASDSPTPGPAVAATGPLRADVPAAPATNVTPAPPTDATPPAP